MIGEKGYYCLLLAALPVGSKNRMELWGQLSERYSEKAVATTLEHLADRGLIDYGVAPQYGWLTDKGRKAKEEVEKDLPQRGGLVP